MNSKQLEQAFNESLSICRSVTTIMDLAKLEKNFFYAQDNMSKFISLKTQKEALLLCFALNLKLMTSKTVNYGGVSLNTVRNWQDYLLCNQQPLLQKTLRIYDLKESRTRGYRPVYADNFNQSK
jgi:hypothetical protein